MINILKALKTWLHNLMLKFLTSDENHSTCRGFHIFIIITVLEAGHKWSEISNDNVTYPIVSPAPRYCRGLSSLRSELSWDLLPPLDSEVTGGDDEEDTLATDILLLRWLPNDCVEDNLNFFNAGLLSELLM